MTRVIAFTGQDGTGKSTQMQRLQDRLRGEGLHVAVVHQYGPTTALGRAIGPLAKRLANRLKRGRRAGGTGGGRRSGPRLLHRAAAWVSLTVGWTRSIVHRRLHGGCDVLILDRCYADEVVRAAHKFGRISRLGVWLLRRCVPRPDVTITFTLDPRTGWERKKTREMTLEEYEEKIGFVRQTLEAVQDLWTIVTVPVDGRTPDDVFQDVWNAAKGTG